MAPVSRHQVVDACRPCRFLDDVSAQTYHPNGGHPGRVHHHHHGARNRSDPANPIRVAGIERKISPILKRACVRRPLGRFRSLVAPWRSSRCVSNG